PSPLLPQPPYPTPLPYTTLFRSVRVTTAISRHALDTNRKKHIALARLDGVRSHTSRHQRGRAVPVDGHPGHVQARQDRHHAADVVPLLAAGKAAPTDQVFNLSWVERGNLVEYFGHDV